MWLFGDKMSDLESIKQIQLRLLIWPKGKIKSNSEEMGDIIDTTKISRGAIASLISISIPWDTHFFSHNNWIKRKKVEFGTWR